MHEKQIESGQKKMVRIIALLLVLFTLALTSCAAQSAPILPPQAKFYSSETYQSAIEMPSRVLLVQTGGLYYYSKVDGESYRFCFNPLCQHTYGENCPSRLFWLSGSMPGVVTYSEETERVYLA